MSQASSTAATAMATPKPRSWGGRVLDYVLLPQTISAFESSYLTRMNRIAALFFYAHLPLFMGLAWINGTGVVSAALLTCAVLVVPFFGARAFQSERVKSMSHGFTAMCIGGVLVHLGQGPVQIEMHFYFFSVLAMLALFANPMVIVVAAATVALHHLALWAVAPKSIFNYDAPIWVVLVHAAFVVLETVAACFIARNFFDNVIGLEKKVEARTAEVNERNRDMRLVLDNVRQALVTVDTSGVLSMERSKALVEWFGDYSAGDTVHEYLGKKLPDFGAWLGMGWDSLTDGFMPLEVVLDQLPRTAEADGRHFGFAYEPILDDDGELAKVLLVVTDCTQEVEYAAFEQRQRETIEIFQRILQDRQGFMDFFGEATRMLNQLEDLLESDEDTAKRFIHTVKGNAGLFKLDTVAQACHSLEDAIAEADAPAAAAESKRLHERWAELSKTVGQLAGDSDASTVSMTLEEHQALLEKTVAGAPHADIAKALVDLTLEATETRLERLAEHAHGLALRLEKEALEVEACGNGLRIERERFSDFWSSLVHVLRNAIDHGIEPTDERVASGKNSQPQLHLRTFTTEDSFTVEIEDDGRGIDWDSVQAQGEKLGLPTAEIDDLKAILFQAGVSTKDAVTEWSGRGVGLSAVREACQALGGEISIETKSGEFTRFQFRFPLSSMANYPSGV